MINSSSIWLIVFTLITVLYLIHIQHTELNKLKSNSLSACTFLVMCHLNLINEKMPFKECGKKCTLTATCHCQYDKYIAHAASILICKWDESNIKPEDIYKNGFTCTLDTEKFTKWYTETTNVIKQKNLDTSDLTITIQQDPLNLKYFIASCKQFPGFQTFSSSEEMAIREFNNLLASMDNRIPISILNDYTKCLHFAEENENTQENNQ